MARGTSYWPVVVCTGFYRPVMLRVALSQSGPVCKDLCWSVLVLLVVLGRVWRH